MDAAELERAVAPRVRPKVLVIIRTYQRPRLLQLLLTDIASQATVDLHVRIYDDGSPDEKSYHSVRTLCDEHGWDFISCAHRGKKRAWALFNHIFRDVKVYRQQSAKMLEDSDLLYYYFLDDDMRLCHRFFERSLQVWESTPANKRVTLQLMIDSDRGAGPCWTGLDPKEISPCEGSHDSLASIGLTPPWPDLFVGDDVIARDTGWVDGPFLCQGRFFDRLEHKVRPIDQRRWVERPHVSTGVGQQLSHRLVDMRLGLYQAAKSLVVHSGADSHMNPTVRAVHPLEVVDFVDGDDRARQLMSTTD